MTTEQLFQTAQGYVNTPGLPLIVLGSGASMSYGLPGMLALADELKKIKIVNTCDEECWAQFLSLIDSEDLETVLLKVHLTETVMKDVISCTWKFITQADIHLFNDVILQGKELPLKDLFTHLLSSSSKSLNVVTTNYDRLAEYAAAVNNLYPFTFFNSGHFSSFIGEQDDCFTRAKGCKGVLNICKLHGSLDWFSLDKPYRMHKSIPQQNFIPPGAEPCIITPGIEKYRKTTQTPFRELFQIADQQIMNSSSYLCIGYGFNDDHVHPKILDNITRNKKPLVVITKELSVKAKEIIKLHGADKILLIEEGPENASIVYTKKDPHGVLFNEPYWNLTSFLTLLT